MKLIRIVSILTPVSSSWNSLYKELNWNSLCVYVGNLQPGYTWGHSERFWLVTASRCRGCVAVGQWPNTLGRLHPPGRTSGPSWHKGQWSHWQTLSLIIAACSNKKPGPHPLPPTGFQEIGDFMGRDPEAGIFDMSYPDKEMWLLWWSVRAATAAAIGGI